MKQKSMCQPVLGPSQPVTRQGLCPQEPPPPGRKVSDTTGRREKMTLGCPVNEGRGSGGQECGPCAGLRLDAVAKAETGQLSRSQSLTNTWNDHAPSVRTGEQRPCRDHLKAPASLNRAYLPHRNPVLPTRGQDTELGKGSRRENQKVQACK